MNHKTRLVLWKIYLWIILANSTAYFWQGFSRYWEIIDFGIFIVGIVGFFSFIWRKRLFSQIFWKLYFLIQIMWNILYLFVLPLPDKMAQLGMSQGMSHIEMSVVSFIFYIPLFYGLYYYAYRDGIFSETK